MIINEKKGAIFDPDQKSFPQLYLKKGGSDGSRRPKQIGQDLDHEPDIFLRFVLDQVVLDMHDTGRFWFGPVFLYKRALQKFVISRNKV